VPRRMGAEDSFLERMIVRSFRRPRHLIMYMNECIRLSDGKGKFTQQIIRSAEASYSKIRLNAIKDEWGESFELIDYAFQFLSSNNKASFKVENIQEDTIDSLILEIGSSQPKLSENLTMKRYATEAFDRSDKVEKFVANWMKTLFRIGLIGVKTEATETYRWNYDSEKSISAGAINAKTSIKVHPMFWAALSIPPIRVDNFIDDPS